MRIKKRSTVQAVSTENSPQLSILMHMIMVATAIFITIALLSYNHHDAGFTKSITEDSYILNLEGLVGAYIADVLFYFFGVSAFLLPISMLTICWTKLRSKESTLHSYTIIGSLLLFVSVDALLALHLPFHTALPAGIGGALGEYIAWKFVSVLNVLGATFVLLTIAYSGIILVNPEGQIRWLMQIGKALYAKITHCIHVMGHRIKLPERKPRESKPTLTDEVVTAITEPPSQIAETLPSQVPIAPTITSPAPVNTAPTKTTSLHMVNTSSHFSRIALPESSLLDPVEKNQRVEIAKSVIINLSKDVEKKFLDFGFKLDVVAVYPGPVVTRFELKLAPGTKVSSIANLAKDLARTLSVTSVRIVDVIPGKSVIGLEIPNTKRQIVRLRDLIDSNSFSNALSPVTIVLGKDISGHPVVVDLAKMPHLLVAGTTGSGKSVGLNAMLLSFLYKSTCENLRMILIDPKMLELSVYDDIPHLLTPVITDMGEAAGALRWCVGEMERRYKLMSVLGVRNIAGYNSKVAKANKEGAPLLDPLYVSDDGSEAPPLENLPAIVVVADEYADMIMVLGKKVEQLIARLAQKARAAGIHLVLATQRPSVNVVTGLIKANIPTRIAFQVSSRIDSRTVLDQQGAEQLLGHGDMLYLPPGTGVPVRVHGAYVSDDEVHRVVKFIKDNNPPPQYVDNMVESIDLGEGDSDSDSGSSSGASGEQDPLYDEAVSIVAKTKKASISSIQRKLKIGYNRSANIVEAMEKAGVVSAPSHNGSREVLIDDIRS